ncbi:MAG: DNA/RNA non-specific endonuclease [Bacteroidales bacterium]|nr:DNA/RNA non-specific endonuclease [Bacteroidales bacterium]
MLTYYSLSYSEAHEQAEWVFYILTKDMVNGTTERTDNFREAPKISTGSASLADSKYSGYDRGHLAPAKAMSLNDTSMSKSFFLSNKSPQNASFNRGK